MLPLNFNHFYYFYEVARSGSFTGAARELMVSQSALSVQVKQLEESLGAQLFDRNKGGVALTEAGTTAYQVAERVFPEIDRLRATMQESERMIIGRVTIGTVNSIGIYVLPEILTVFKEEFPDVSLKVDFKEADPIMDLLRAGRVDFSILPWDRKYPELTSVRLTKSKMFLVAPTDHPLARKRSISPRELEQYPFVGYEEGMYTRTMIDGLFRRMAVTVEYSIESANSATIKHMVMAGMGVGVLPEFAVSGEIRRRQLARLEVPTLTMSQDMTLYYRSNRALSGTQARFMAFLLDHFKPKPRRRPPGRSS